LTGLVIAPDYEQILAVRAVPMRREIEDAGITRIETLHDAIPQRSVALDHTPAHDSDTVVDYVLGQDPGMSRDVKPPWLVGIDGCRAGWIAAFVRPDGYEVLVRVVERFADVLEAPEAPVVIAIDMPIGLPDRIGAEGRGPERAIRPLLGARQSSVFSVPSRTAIYAADFRAACAAALATSEPPRKVSKQLFMIVPKIKEVDTALRADRSTIGRVYEVHPELAFWRLNKERALDLPKKVKGTCYGPGLTLRQALLEKAGIPVSVVEGVPPKGAAVDDLLDALACATAARSIHAGHARPFPNPPGRDGFDLPIAIWA
jgi:predicted RNase H-like nuclease